jgi:integrase
MAKETPEQLKSLAHLTRRNSTYYFRIRVPQDVLAHFGGRREIKKSLNTSDKSLASLRVRELSIQYLKHFDALRTGQSSQSSFLDVSAALSEPLSLQPASPACYHVDEEFIEWLCINYVRESMSDDDALRCVASFGEADWDAYHEKLLASQDVVKKAYKLGRWEEASGVLTNYMHRNGIAIDCSEESEPYQQLSHRFLAAMLQVNDAIFKKNQGQFVPRPTSVPPPYKRPELAGSTDKAIAVERLSGFLEAWRSGGYQRAKTISEVNSLFREFVSFLIQKKFTVVTKSAMVEYRDYLIKNKSLGHKTVKKKLSLLSAVFQRAYDDGNIEGNPVQGVRVDKPRVQSEPRKPFSDEDLRKIFSSPVYSNHEIPSGGKRDAAIWLPLLALFTGARLEELGQLKLDNIKNDSEFGWFISITDSDGNQRLKTTSSRRVVPIHPYLIEVGFIRFFEESKKNNKDGWLFSSLKPASDGTRTGNWSKWFGRYLRETVKIVDSRLVFHSFRHTFKNRCRQAGVPEDIHDALTGHVNNSVGRSYGGQYPLKPLVEAVKKIDIQINLKLFAKKCGG